MSNSGKSKERFGDAQFVAISVENERAELNRAESDALQNKTKLLR